MTYLKLHMKKILFLLVIFFTLVACDNPHHCTKINTISVKVLESEWQYTDYNNNNYFYAIVDMPEITENIFDNGEVKAYIVFDRLDYYYARKHLLPYVLHVEEPTEDNDWKFFTETIDFTYGIGWAEFNVNRSDFEHEIDLTINPVAMEFDIVITTPQN